MLPSKGFQIGTDCGEGYQFLESRLVVDRLDLGAELLGSRAEASDQKVYDRTLHGFRVASRVHSALSS